MDAKIVKENAREKERIENIRDFCLHRDGMTACVIYKRQCGRILANIVIPDHHEEVDISRGNGLPFEVQFNNGSILRFISGENSDYLLATEYNAIAVMFPSEDFSKDELHYFKRRSCLNVFNERDGKGEFFVSSDEFVEASNEVVLDCKIEYNPRRKISLWERIKILFIGHSDKESKLRDDLFHRSMQCNMLHEKYDTLHDSGADSHLNLGNQIIELSSKLESANLKVGSITEKLSQSSEAICSWKSKYEDAIKRVAIERNGTSDRIDHIECLEEQCKKLKVELETHRYDMSNIVTLKQERAQARRKATTLEKKVQKLNDEVEAAASVISQKDAQMDRMKKEIETDE